MKKLMILSLVALTLAVLTGCKSYTTKTIEETIRPDGTVATRVTTVTRENSPFYYKAMSSILQVWGFDVSFISPEDGSTAPRIIFRRGDSIMGSLPVTSETDNRYEIFGTYKEEFCYSTSIFSLGANTGDFKYSRVAGGIGVLAVDGTIDKTAKLKQFVDMLNSVQDSLKTLNKE